MGNRGCGCTVTAYHKPIRLAVVHFGQVGAPPAGRTVL